MKHVIVIGGGAAGCMAAVAAAQKGAAVTLLERNPKLGRKLYITGKGRCNVTNDCAAPEVLQNVPRNSRFLTSAVTRFPPEAVKAFFEGLGVPLKTERGNRVFPCSDKAADIIDALLLALRRSGVHIVQDRARALRREGEILTGVEGERGFYPGGAVVIATGGVSYPLTGSTGDGYALAVALGHTILPPRGSLVPLVAEGDACAKMQGLSLRNVAIQVRNSKKKTVYAGQGELLFTHFGLSGPLILSASAHMRDFDTEHYYINLDLKPALDEEKLDRRLLRDFEENANRDFHNVLEGLVPRLMVPVLVERTGIPAAEKVHSVTKAQRRRLLEVLKCLRIDIQGPRPVEEAIVTSGGIKVSEINPTTLESKKAPGVYFAGEVLDVDAYTGGFNLQIAWSTGHAAGEAAAQSGPLILSASAHMRDFDTEHYYINLDLKPALDEEKLDRRLLRDFEENANRDFHNVLEGLVPRLMVPVLVERTGIPAAEKVHSVTKAQRRRLLEVLKCLRIDIQGPRPVEEAIVTSGGIKVSEINPTTLESKKAPGVYFAGEVLDVDAYTGGFNLQIAWSTGHAAGEAAAQDIGGINP